MYYTAVMLLFISGRTDIPAFYTPWFMNRIREGFVDVRNPYYGEQVSRYRLDPEVTDCLVFCTKNPAPILPYISELKGRGFALYFFVTITPYGTDIEPNVPDKSAVMQSFRELSERTGSRNCCWRYDPVFIDETYSAAFHIRQFRQMAETLHGATDRCIISFIDLYQKTVKNFPGVKEVSEQDQRFLAQVFSRIGMESGITIETCAEKLDLTGCGVAKGICISRSIIEQTTGGHVIKKPGVQHLRKHCMCLPAHDIGSYNSCPHLCKYCYANYNEELVKKNHAMHDPSSPLLIGHAAADQHIHDAEQKSLLAERRTEPGQLPLFADLMQTGQAERN